MLNAGDTAWLLTATTLVLFMTLPGLALFYGGLVRSKNALNTMMMSFVALGAVGIAWALIGYSLAFSAGGPYLGDLSNLFLKGVFLDPRPGTTIPHVLYFCYQGTFAIITAAAGTSSIKPNGTLPQGCPRLDNSRLALSTMLRTRRISSSVVIIGNINRTCFFGPAAARSTARI